MLLITLIAIVTFAALSAAAIYFYGRFARHAQGPAGHAIPPDGPTPTALDRAVMPLAAAHPDETGILLVDDNREAFELRALTAREAGRSLDLQYYIWKDDDTGRLLVREVLRAADRGVRVRVLLDDINARGKDHAILALDSHPHIEVRLFNPARNRDDAWRRAGEMLLRFLSLNRRMHNKAWIADGRIAIVGGRNVGDEYFDAAEQVNFQDADLLLVGPAVAQTSAIFDEFWNSEAVIPIRALHRMRWRRRHRMLPEVRNALEALALGRADSPWLGRMSDAALDLSSRVGTPGRLAWSAGVEVVSDPPEKAAPFSQQQLPERWLVHKLAPLMAGALGEALLTSPYFVPGEQVAAQLVACCRSGATVRVLTNSLAATDVALVHAGYSKYRKALLEGGVRIHELRPVHRKRIGLLRVDIRPRRDIIRPQERRAFTLIKRRRADNIPIVSADAVAVQRHPQALVQPVVWPTYGIAERAEELHAERPPSRLRPRGKPARAQHAVSKPVDDLGDVHRIDIALLSRSDA